MDNLKENHKLLFDLYDKDNDGFLTVEEIKFILNNMEINYNEKNWNLNKNEEKLNLEQFHDLLINKLFYKINTKEVEQNFHYLNNDINSNEIDSKDLKFELLKNKNIWENDIDEIIKLGEQNNKFNLNKYIDIINKINN